jgi:predicted double-glycine peptidase
VSTTRIELAPDSGYRLTVTAVELGRISEALRHYASWWKQNMSNYGGERHAAEIEALRMAIDPEEMP